MASPGIMSGKSQAKRNTCGPDPKGFRRDIGSLQRTVHTPRELGQPRLHRYRSLVQVRVDDIEGKLHELANVLEAKGCQMSADEHRMSLKRIKEVYRSLKCTYSVEMMICGKEEQSNARLVKTTAA